MSYHDPKILAEIAKSYNDDVKFEDMHRNNMAYEFVINIVWIITSIACAWRIITLDKIEVTLLGLFIITVNILGMVCNHLKHKKRVHELLQYRTLVLQMKDQA